MKKVITYHEFLDTYCGRSLNQDGPVSMNLKEVRALLSYITLNDPHPAYIHDPINQSHDIYFAHGVGLYRSIGHIELHGDLMTVRYDTEMSREGRFRLNGYGVREVAGYNALVLKEGG